MGAADKHGLWSLENTITVIGMRWNWLVLVAAGGICVLTGIAGVAVGAVSTTDEPAFFLGLGVPLVIAGFVLRRWYKRYEAEAMASATEDLEVDGKQSDALQ